MLQRAAKIRCLCRGQTSVLSIPSRCKVTSSHQWLQRHLKDPYVKDAVKQGYRARSAFKLIEVNKACKPSLLQPGLCVIECGAAPGAWTQVAAKAINAAGAYSPDEPHGILVGCDLLSIEAVPGAILLPNSDFTSPLTQEQIRTHCNGKAVNAVLSDMAPNATGDSSLDHESIVRLCYIALRFALSTSDRGADFLCKLWNGPKLKPFITDAQKFFKDVRTIKPKSSRRDSAEMYVLARGFKGIKKK